MDFETLSRWAEDEVRAVRKALPKNVCEAADKVLLSFEDTPDTDGPDAGLIGDELGLFEGAPLHDAPDPLDMPRIRLFLGNIWDWVEGDEDDYRDEVGTTYLHELGHYLGWDEKDLADRGLD